MSQLVAQTQAFKNVSETLQNPNILAQLKMALPSHITPERLVRIVLTEVRRTPKLLECSRESLFGAVLQCAQLGLEPGVLGQAWIIPFGREATFIPGYRGLCQLAYRSSLVKQIAMRPVFEGDLFAFDFGEDRITHQPGNETDPAKLTHVWAMIHTSNGGRLWDVMRRAEVEAIRKRSRAGESGPWKTDYVQMALKTVLRRLLKIAPTSPELQTAIGLDDAADSGLPQGIDFALPIAETATPDEPQSEVSTTPTEAA